MESREAGLRRGEWRALALALGLIAASTSTAVLAAELAAPPSLVELRLGHTLRGDEARREVDRLHGKGIAFRDALVAHYEGAEGIVMLYVSEAADAATAGGQVEKMTTGIRSGKGPFTHLRERTQDGATVFSSLGQGQVHYYFRRGARVVWVAADPMLARRALAELLQFYR